MKNKTPALLKIIYGVLIALPIITVFAGRFMEAVVPLLSFVILFYYYKNNHLKTIKVLFLTKIREPLWISIIVFFIITAFSVLHGYESNGRIKAFFLTLITFIGTLITGYFIINIKEKQFFRYFTYSIIVASCLTVLLLLSLNRIEYMDAIFKSHLFNRVAAALSIWAIPLIYYMRQNRPLQITLILAVSLVAVISDSGTAPFVLICALIAFILTFTLKKPFIIVSAIALFGVILLLPWLATLPKALISAEIHNTLKNASTHHRVEIWNSYAILAQQKWFTGWGFEAARNAINTPEIFTQFKDPGFLLGAHPHFIILQIYFEQGVLAIIAIITAFYALLRKILVLEPIKAAVCIASFVGTLAMISVNFSIWQQWVIVMIGLQIAFCVKLSRDAH